MTDIEGNFILSVPDSAVLQVSFVGYESIEVSVGGRKTLEIQLRENTVMLDNVIITALGLEKKRGFFSIFHSESERGGTHPYERG